MDTLGSLVDKLSIINLKMWNAQENFYEIRHMTFDEFMETFYSEEGMRDLFNRFQKGIDLNLQRNNLIDEIDERIVQMLHDSVSDRSLEKYIQRKYKSY